MPCQNSVKSKVQSAKSRKTIDYSLLTIHWRHCRFGFTLIESLVVLGILLIAVGSSLLFLTSLLRGTNQANVTSEVKQNGQVVLDSIDRQIRNALSVECKNTSGLAVACNDGSVSKKYLKLAKVSGSPLHVKCFNDGPGPKASNGWIGTVESAVENPDDTSYASLTNKDNLIAGVDIQNCNFTVLPALSGPSPAIVIIRFVVNQGVNAPSRQDFLANVSFQTTISLRKY